MIARFILALAVGAVGVAVGKATAKKTPSASKAVK